MPEDCDFPLSWETCVFMRKFSELINQDQQKDNCIQIYAEISELTPLKEDLLLEEDVDIHFEQICPR